MIEWLEEYFSAPNISLFMVTHDRYFLNRVCNQILELDRGKAYKYNGDYNYFLEKKAEREEITAGEIDKAKNLYRKEMDWMRRMPKARGTKAKSRIDRFYETEKKAKQKVSQKKVELSIKSERLGGKILEMHHVRKSFGSLKIVDDFSYTFKKGDRLGIAGKNGVGKTTFLNLIMGKEFVDGGKIVRGETVEFGYYTQGGIQLKEDKRIIEVVKEIAEVIPLEKGRKITASQLLERFLFPPKQQYTPVSKLSGGEKKRLYLLTVLSRNPNFLILDEPTNDLDIKTIQVLEDFLMDFPGCIIIVSHDRAFMDQLTNHIFYFRGEGEIKDYNKSYSEIIELQKREESQAKKSFNMDQTGTQTQADAKKNDYSKKLSYMERREFNQLEKRIEELEVQKKSLSKKLSDTSLESDELIKLSKQLGDIVSSIEQQTERWLKLADRA